MHKAHTSEALSSENNLTSTGNNGRHPVKPVSELFIDGFFTGEHPAWSRHSGQQWQQLNELYRFVTEITNDCLWEWDLGRREVFWIDGGHRRVFGYEVENALIPQNFWESCLHPDDKVRVLTRLNKMITGGAGTFWEEEYRFKKAGGDYVYVWDRAHIVYNADRVAVRMIGATADITEKVLMENRLAQERLSRQEEITNAVLTAQESERTAIGRELHDNLNQILGATKLYIELARTDEESRDMCLEKAAGYIVTVIEEIRRISKILASPGMLMGLLESIMMLVHDLIMIHPLKIEFHEEKIDEEKLDKKLQQDLFRIVQEQLNNILKHADATLATINLTRRGNLIRLLIADDGKGCDPLKEGKGVGIINIKSRVELYHGKVNILSAEGEGYILEVILPVKRQRNARAATALIP